jgi:hypothetical protein
LSTLQPDSWRFLVSSPLLPLGPMNVSLFASALPLF